MPESQFTTGMLFIKTKNSKGQDTVAYYHHDHLETPIQATDKAGNMVWAARYEAFGKATITTPQATADKPTITSNLRLPGQYEDAETGLHYNFRRYCDPETGRYISQDPIGLEGGVNLYTYVNGSPVMDIDPTGLVKVHGNWCGPNWTGGREHTYHDAPPGYYSPPVSMMDNACRRHDICYDTCRQSYKCNKNARGKCMTICDRDLASSTSLGFNSGTSFATSFAIYIWMRYNTFSDPGENDPSCRDCDGGK